MTSLKVTGMQCEGCEKSVQKALGKIDSVSDVKADREDEKVDFNFNGSEDTLNSIKAKIDELGYKVVG